MGLGVVIDPPQDSLGRGDVSPDERFLPWAFHHQEGHRTIRELMRHGLFQTHGLGEYALNTHLSTSLEGLNPNAGDKQGMTPLHLAVLDGRTDLVGTLLRAGADIQARDARGETPLAVAQDFGHADIVALMQKGPGEAKALPDPGEKKTMAHTP